MTIANVTRASTVAALRTTINNLIAQYRPRVWIGRDVGVGTTVNTSYTQLTIPAQTLNSDPTLFERVADGSGLKALAACQLRVQADLLAGGSDSIVALASITVNGSREIDSYLYHVPSVGKYGHPTGVLDLAANDVVGVQASVNTGTLSIVVLGFTAEVAGLA